MSAATIYNIIFIYFLLTFSYSSDVAMAGRNIPSSVPSTMRPASVDYVKMNPQVNHKHEVFKEKGVKGCMPKGSTHTSAPSRYANYQILGSTCATKTHSEKP